MLEGLGLTSLYPYYYYCYYYYFCKYHNAFEQSLRLAHTQAITHTNLCITDSTEYQYDKTCITGLVLYLCLDAASETLLLVQLTWIYLLPLPHYYTLQ